MLVECMEIYGCLFECKIEEIFKHYTDEIEAVQHAKDIEEAYVKIIETGITKAQPHVITIEKLKTKIEQLLRITIFDNDFDYKTDTERMWSAI